MSNVEVVQPPRTIQELIDRTVQKFRGRNLDETGWRAYLVNNAVWDVITASGLSSSDMVGFVLGQTSLSEDQVSLIRGRLPIEGRDGYQTEEYRNYVLAGNILIEEIRQMNPELISEEERKLEKLGFKLGNPSF